MSQVPTIGRIVQYKLTKQDADAIGYARQVSTVTARQGNPAEEGQVYPAMIVRTWGATPGSAVNLQVFLDGNDSLWVTSATEGNGPRQFAWPARV